MSDTIQQDESRSPAISVGAISVAGKVRDENQDRMSRSQAPLGDLYIVADGMGGYQGGATAAKIAVDTIEQVFREAGPGSSPLATIQTAVQQANVEINREAAAGKPEFEKMGSTAVVLLVKDGVAYVGHVGDSRAYLVRDGKLDQLTVDHTVVQGLVNQGVLSQEEARDHEDASKLTRVLGRKPEVDVDLEPPIPLQRGDGLLLCSDGLSGYVGDGEIQRAIAQERRVQKIAGKLVDLAMEAGGEDNITVQFLRYGDDDPNAVEIVADEDIKRSGGARAWKIGGSLVAAVALGSAATFVYLNVWKPASLTGGISATQPSNAAMLAGPRVSDHVDELQKQVRDLTVRVQKLEAAAIRPGSPKDAGDKPGSKGRAPRTGKDDKTSVPKGAGPNPAAPVSEGAPTGAEAGAGNPALSAPPPDQGARPPEPPPKTGDTKKEAGDTKKGDAEPRKQ